MKLAKNKKSVQTKPLVAKQKSSFDFKSFWNSVNSLNKDNYGSAPWPVRIFVMAMIFVAILVIAWFTLVGSKLDDIKSAEAEQVTLLEDYKAKEARARYLDEYRAQVSQMEFNFKELLNQLPKTTRISELIEGINMVGVSSGIRFQDLSVDDEKEHEFFVERAINIQATGGYHQFGDFITGIAALPRIITMHDFEVVNAQPSLDKMPELQFKITTKTYRAKEVVDTAAPADPAATTDPAVAAEQGGNQ